MAREWADDEVLKEISDAVRIVREDRFESFVRGRLSPEDKNNGDNNPPKSGGNNPDPNGDGKPSRKSLWWGDET